MNKNLTIAMTTAMLLSGGVAQTQAQDVNIGKSKQVMLKGDIMTPETLWAMGRVGSAAASPDGKQVVYQVGYYSVKENRGHQVLFIMNADGTGQTKLTTDAKSESDPVWIEGGKRIAFLRGGQIWAMNPEDSSSHPTAAAYCSSSRCPITARSRRTPTTFLWHQAVSSRT